VSPRHLPPFGKYTMSTSNSKLMPSLNDITQDPSKVDSLSDKQSLDMLIKVTGLIPILMSRTAQINADPLPPKNVLITVEEAAKTISMSEDWIYRNKSTLPFVVVVGGCIRINQAKLDKAINEGQM
jgi:hypothetical protein